MEMGSPIELLSPQEIEANRKRETGYLDKIERLRAALKPFADYVDQLDGKIPPKCSGPSMKDWLAAHAAVNQQLTMQEK
jgi:hypothetical protein